MHGLSRTRTMQIRRRERGQCEACGNYKPRSRKQILCEPCSDTRNARRRRARSKGRRRAKRAVRRGKMP